MEAELERLIEQKRACGSEDERRRLEQELRELQQRVHTLVVSPAPASSDTVCFGAQVKVRDSRGSETSCRIVGIDEADLDRDWITWRSPLARALLSHRVGDKIQFKVPAGVQEFEILEISYPSET
jgi:transcription elongation factor GreB